MTKPSQVGGSNSESSLGTKTSSLMKGHISGAIRSPLHFLVLLLQSGMPGREGGGLTVNFMAIDFVWSAVPYSFFG